MPVAQRCSFAVGDKIDGRFRVRKILGDGSFGIVYKVSGPDMNDYALKVLKLWTVPPDGHEKLRARFVMEYETGKITSDHLVHSYAYGEILGNPYIQMEYCPLGDLRSYSKTHNVNVPQIARDILEGLHALHSRGKVHRDLKPENVLLKQDGTGVLTDFGISGDQNKRMTERGLLGKPQQIFGTYSYMPPEQVNPPRGGQATVLPTTDIFSFGVLIYELMVGKLPFGILSEETLADYLKNGKDGNWDREALRRVDPSGFWNRIIEGSLTPDFHQRTQSVKDILSLFSSASSKEKSPVIDSLQPAVHGILLRIMQGEDYGRVYYLDNLLKNGYLMTVGRNDGFTNNAISITESNSKYISRHHCTLEKDSATGQWFIRDGQFLNRRWETSTNGTYVNSQEADRLGLPINVGDIISIGDVKMRVEGY